MNRTTRRKIKNKMRVGSYKRINTITKIRLVWTGIRIYMAE
jgi:hypothetical protein